MEKFVHYHVYRQDHTGRGVRQNDGPLGSYDDAEIFMAGVRATKPPSLGAGICYIVGEREDGTFMAYPLKPEPAKES